MNDERWEDLVSQLSMRTGETPGGVALHVRRLQEVYNDVVQALDLPHDATADRVRQDILKTMTELDQLRAENRDLREKLINVDDHALDVLRIQLSNERANSERLNKQLELERSATAGGDILRDVLARMLPSVSAAEYTDELIVQGVTHLLHNQIDPDRITTMARRASNAEHQVAHLTGQNEELRSEVARLRVELNDRASEDIYRCGHRHPLRKTLRCTEGLGHDGAHVAYVPTDGGESTLTWRTP